MNEQRTRNRAKVGAAGLAGVLLTLAPTLPALYTSHEEQSACRASLELIHESQKATQEIQKAVQASYTALVNQVAKHSLGHGP